VASDLGAELIAALDRSCRLILIASRASAESRYVDAEVRHLVDAGRLDDVRVVVLEKTADGAVPLPPVLARVVSQGWEPLWLDAERTSRPDQQAVVRLAAGMLGVSFDALWRRDVRRRITGLLAAAAALVLVASVVGAVLVRQRDATDELRTAHQESAFRAYLTQATVDKVREDDPGRPPPDVQIDILRSDDLNGDSWMDFFAINRTPGFCGSGGCATEAYLGEGDGRYRVVANLFGSGAPHTRAADGGYKQILTAFYSVDGEPVYSVFRWNGTEYALYRFEFCNGVRLEYCSRPVLITPRADDERTTLPLTEKSKVLAGPASGSPPVRVMEAAGDYGVFVGTVEGGAWLLIDVLKARAGFVRRSDATR